MSSPARTLFSLTLPLAQWVQKPLKTEVKRVVKKTTRLNEHVSMPSRAPAFSLLSSRNQTYFRVFHARCLTCVTPSAQEASPREIAVREAPRRPCPRDRRRRPPGTASRRPLGRKTHTTPPLIKQESTCTHSPWRRRWRATEGSGALAAPLGRRLPDEAGEAVPLGLPRRLPGHGRTLTI